MDIDRPTGQGFPELPKQEVKPAKEKTLKTIGTNLEKTRMTIANWLMVIAAIGMFFGYTVVFAGTAQQKDWIFWVALIGLGFLAASILSGLSSHIAYVWGMTLFKEGEVTETCLLCDSCSLTSLWVQMGTFGIGILLDAVVMLALWVRAANTTPW